LISITSSKTNESIKFFACSFACSLEIFSVTLKYLYSTFNLSLQNHITFHLFKLSHHLNVLSSENFKAGQDIWLYSDEQKSEIGLNDSDTELVGRISDLMKLKKDVLIKHLTESFYKISIAKKDNFEDKEATKEIYTSEVLNLKTEYRTESGAIEAHIVGSGEMFWGGTNTPKEQINLEIIELEIDPYDTINTDYKSFTGTDISRELAQNIIDMILVQLI
jgi:hypothetical protein